MMTGWLFVAIAVQCVAAAEFWVAPGSGTGDGRSRASPHGSLSDVQSLMSDGDTLVIRDGTYNQPLVVRRDSITIRAETRGRVVFDMLGEQDHAVTVLGRKHVTIDGIKGGHTKSWAFHCLNNSYLTIRNCGCWDAATTPAECDADYNKCNINRHCFEMAYGDHYLLEDSWSWGAARYNAVLYQTSDSAIRRFACHGSVWASLPHACLTSYCNQRSQIENAVVTGIRLSKSKPAGGPFAFVHGGFVSDAHDCGDYTPAHQNELRGIISIDNGTPRSERADSSPYQFLVMSDNGWDVFDESAAVSSANQGDFFVTLNDNRTPQSYWHGPTNYFQAAGKWAVCKGGDTQRCPPKDQRVEPVSDLKVLNRWVDGVYTNEPMFPWPNEDLIKEDFGMDETITEFVRRKLEGIVEIPQGVSTTTTTKTTTPSSTTKTSTTKTSTTKTTTTKTTTTTQTNNSPISTTTSTSTATTLTQDQGQSQSNTPNNESSTGVTTSGTPTTTTQQVENNAAPMVVAPNSESGATFLRVALSAVALAGARAAL